MSRLKVIGVHVCVVCVCVCVCVCVHVCVVCEQVQREFITSYMGDKGNWMTAVSLCPHLLATAMLSA